MFEGQPYVSVVDLATSQTKLTKLKGTEPAVVDQVAIIGTKAHQIEKVSGFFFRGLPPFFPSIFPIPH